MFLTLNGSLRILFSLFETLFKMCIYIYILQQQKQKNKNLIIENEKTT